MRSILLLLPFTLATACTATAIDANNPLTLLVGPDGGSVESDGLKIDVPAGAVNSEVTLTAYPKDRVIDGVTTASQTWSFGPDGQKFNTAIAVSFAYEGQHDAATVWWTKEGDLTTFSNLKTTKADGWATANVVHFSEGAVGDDACSSGSGATDEEDADSEEADDGDEADTADSGDEEDGDCVDGIDSTTGEECDGGPSANQDDGEDTGDEADAEEEDDGGDESDGVDCEDGIDAATGEECDGGPSANQDDGEEADDEEEHGSCERDESEANDEDDGEEGDEGDDTDNVEE